MPDDSIPRSILLLIMILAGGFFAGSETAFSYCNRIRIRMLAEDGDRRARRATWVLDRYERAVVSTLIAINILYITSASVATVLAVEMMGASGGVVSTVVMTLLIFFFCETIPKNIARTNSDAYAMLAAPLIRVYMKAVYPLALVLMKIGDAAKKRLRSGEAPPTLTEDEFATVVEDAQEEGTIEPVETQIIKSAIEFSDRVARDVMTPFKDVEMVDIRWDQEKLKEVLIESHFSRFPVYDGEMNHIVGVLQSVNCLWKLMNGKEVRIASEMSKPYFVRPDTRLTDVFESMGARRTHFAIVADETGRTLGILSMEDILEELVGEIYDEDDIEHTGELPPPEREEEHA